MRILEIIEPSFNSYVSKNAFKDDKDERKANIYSTKSTEKHGAYGKIYNKPDDHLISKVNYVSELPHNDGYFTYINYITENKLFENNPYFPRVYKINTLKDSRGKIKYKIDMERLVRLRDVEHSILDQFVETLFEPSQYESCYNFRFGVPQGLAQCLHKVCQNRFVSKDSNLNDACALINKIVAGNPNFELDLHAGNIMVRRSPYPQLVIVDPISQHDYN